MKEYQSRFVAYCKAQGREPEAQLDHDRILWPGGHMAGYMLWIEERWKEWFAAENIRRSQCVLSDKDHVHFDLWLADKDDCGDTGLLLGGLYSRHGDSRVMMLMADHAAKGIWLNELESHPAVTAEDDSKHNWYGSRAEFDASGWRPNAPSEERDRNCSNL